MSIKASSDISLCTASASFRLLGVSNWICIDPICTYMYLSNWMIWIFEATCPVLNESSALAPSLNQV